ncbi:hypothetical protein EON65_46010 [archaeon]|nr:MAG: hypothetical protein EON65_46010 [archaeon]
MTIPLMLTLDFISDKISQSITINPNSQTGCVLNAQHKQRLKAISREAHTTVMSANVQVQCLAFHFGLCFCIYLDRSLSSCFLQVWNLTSLSGNDEVVYEVFRQTPFYTCKLKNDIYQNLEVCEYELDKNICVLFITYSSRRQLFMKKAFISDNLQQGGSIDIQAVQDHFIALDEPLIALSLTLSKEHALLVCCTRSLVWVCTDELEVVQTLPDLSAISLHCTVQSAVICMHPVPMVLVLLRQGLLLVS